MPTAVNHPRAWWVAAAVVVFMLGLTASIFISFYLAKGTADHAVGVAEDQLCSVVTAILTDPGITRQADPELIVSLRQIRREYHC